MLPTVGEKRRPSEKSVEEASGFEDLNGKRREEPAEGGAAPGDEA
jgi:hypothetical protein